MIFSIRKKNALQTECTDIQKKALGTLAFVMKAFIMKSIRNHNLFGPTIYQPMPRDND